MGCSSTVCDRSAAVYEDARVTEAAERLAALIAGDADFQRFTRLARRVRFDEQVADLVNEINASAYQYDPTVADTAALEQRLEDLPLIREYRAAESSARQLFRAVDAEISGVVGAAFAENARACGHG